MELVLIRFDVSTQLRLVNISSYQVCLRSKIGGVSTNLPKAKTCTDSYNQVTFAQNHIGYAVTMRTNKSNVQIILSDIYTIHSR